MPRFFTDPIEGDLALIQGEDAAITSVAAWDESRFSLACQRFREVVLRLFDTGGEALQQ